MYHVARVGVERRGAAFGDGLEPVRIVRGRRTCTQRDRAGGATCVAMDESKECCDDEKSEMPHSSWAVGVDGVGGGTGRGRLSTCLQPSTYGRVESPAQRGSGVVLISKRRANVENGNRRRDFPFPDAACFRASVFCHNPDRSIMSRWRLGLQLKNKAE